jgi:hypothetical protein
MALGAILAELASMLVILSVADYTVRWHAGKGVEWMALNTFRSSMGASERKGSRGMVRDGLWPALRHVALSTVLAALARVRVAVLVAGDTILGSALERAVNVARPAFGLLVFPLEFVPDPVRIECN